jgi:hypothetical protein
MIKHTKKKYTENNSLAEYIFMTIRKIKRSIVYFLQRIVFGFDDRETWNLDVSFYLWLYPRLERFTAVVNGYPNSYSTYEDWILELTRRTNQLKQIIESDEFEFTDHSYLKKEDRKKKYTEFDNARAYYACIEDFNKWFAENINNLWW